MKPLTRPLLLVAAIGIAVLISCPLLRSPDAPIRKGRVALDAKFLEGLGHVDELRSRDIAMRTIAALRWDSGDWYELKTTRSALEIQALDQDSMQVTFLNSHSKAVRTYKFQHHPRTVWQRVVSFWRRDPYWDFAGFVFPPVSP